MRPEARPDSGSETVLIVDDSPDNLLVMKKVLHRAQPELEITTLQDPAQVMEYLLSSNVSTIVCDVQMPVTDGITLCKIIKASPHTQHIPVILITSHTAAPALKAQGLEAGADDFLSRPMDNAELVARIGVGLRIHRAESELRLTTSEAQHRAATIVSSSTDMMALLDHDYVYLEANDAYSKAFNMASGDLGAANSYVDRVASGKRR
jgi:CheY-like chemotaxis protein